MLKRKASGKTVDYQVIAANIDLGFIVQGLDGDFNLNRLERYLVMLKECKITAMVILSKTDLLSEDELSKVVAEIKSIQPTT